MPRIFLLLLALSMTTPGVGAQAPNRDPDQARLVAQDLARFWQAHDAAQAEQDPARRAAIYQHGYLAPGSAGLQEFTRLRIESAADLAATIARHPRYYAQLRDRGERIAAQEPAIRAGMRRMAELHPTAVFPDIYVLIGRMNSGGTLGETGLLIGLEMFGREADTPVEELGPWHRAVVRGLDALPQIVNHELVHYQQRHSFGAAPTLLERCLTEGVADFVTELATGSHINPHVHAWAEPRAAALFREFAAMRGGTETKGWIYDATPGGGRPADLGYWIGYRIARAYYQRSDDKAAALQQLLAIDDAETLLERSGLADEFAPRAPPTG